MAGSQEGVPRFVDNFDWLTGPVDEIFVPEESVSGRFWHCFAAAGLGHEAGSGWLAEVRTALATLLTVQVQGPSRSVCWRKGVQLEGQLHTLAGQALRTARHRGGGLGRARLSCAA